MLAGKARGRRAGPAVLVRIKAITAIGHLYPGTGTKGVPRTVNVNLTGPQAAVLLPVLRRCWGVMNKKGAAA